MRSAKLYLIETTWLAVGEGPGCVSERVQKWVGMEKCELEPNSLSTIQVNIDYFTFNILYIRYTNKYYDMKDLLWLREGGYDHV